MGAQAFRRDHEEPSKLTRGERRRVVALHHREGSLGPRERLELAQLLRRMAS